MMDAERAAPAAYRFDRFTLDLARGVLLGPGGAEVPLRPKSFALLRLLVENAGRLLDRDAIMAAIWPGVLVTDESIAQCVRDIRKALGEEAQDVLRTVPKRGYLFAAEVEAAEASAAVPSNERRLAGASAAGAVGYSRTVAENVAGRSPIAHTEGRTSEGRNIAWPLRRTAIWVASGFLAMVALAFVGHRTLDSPTRDGTRPGVAVLPFQNLSGDAVTGRLADGITEDIITDLARFRNLDVIARNSTAVYEGQNVDVRLIARELRVGYVLEGSIQHEAHQVRVTAQLIDAGTDAHLWSERWDRPIADLFAVQAEISEKVANALGGFAGLVATSDRIAARRKTPADLAAYELYLLGLEKKHGLTPKEAEKVIARMKQVIELDPSLARAWTGLAHAYMGAADWLEDPTELQKASAAAAKRAVDLDPLDAEARAVYGMALGLLGDLRRAEAEFDQAMLLNPASAEVLAWYSGWGSSFNKPAQGAEAAERAIRLNPNYPGWAATTLRYAFFMAGRYDEALHVLGRKPEEDRYDQEKIEEACSLAGLGRINEARAVATQTMIKFPYVSIERHVSRSDFVEHERRRYLELMSLAGFPACATEEQLARFPNPVRLADCERLRRLGSSDGPSSVAASPPLATR